MNSCNNKTFVYKKLFDSDFFWAWKLLINESSKTPKTPKTSWHNIQLKSYTFDIWTSDYSINE
jgi:hypothetical protein